MADARELPFADGSFDAVLEKGTLDAIFLAGEGSQDMRSCPPVLKGRKRAIDHHLVARVARGWLAGIRFCSSADFTRNF